MLKKKPIKRSPKAKTQPKNSLIELMRLQFKPKKERVEIIDGWSPVDIKFPKPFPIDKTDLDRFKVGFWFDLRWPLPIYVKALKDIYHFGKKRMMIESRKERISKEEINKFRELQQKGLNDTEIFRVLYPEFKNFKYTKDYVIGGKKKPAKKLQRVRRISKRAREH